MFEQFDVYEDGGYIEIQAVDFSSGIEIHGVAYGNVDGIGDFNLDYEVPYPSGNWGDGHNIWEFHGQVQRSFIDFENIEDSLERLIEDYAPTVPSWAYREWEMDKALSDADEADMWDSYGDLVEFLSGEGYSDSEIDEIYQYGIDQNYIMPSKEGSMRKRSEVIDWTGMNPYMLLSRMEGDCKYFLNNGNGYEGHLWAGNVQDHIDTMLAIYDKVVEKPEWITREEIEEYGRQMGWTKSAKKAMKKRAWQERVYWSDYSDDDIEQAYYHANDLFDEDMRSFDFFFDSIGCDVTIGNDGYSSYVKDFDSAVLTDVECGYVDYVIPDCETMLHPKSDGYWVSEHLLEVYEAKVIRPGKLEELMEAARSFIDARGSFNFNIDDEVEFSMIAEPIAAEIESGIKETIGAILRELDEDYDYQIDWYLSTQCDPL